ncbi:hypothetical protein F4824DRAFT_501199 [Ustulina deusta]|nr:hypothetical protein F4824DRAFT_501199 [Ustulina deusta]
MWFCRGRFSPPKYHVGVSKHTIEHYNPYDLLAPNNVSTTHIGSFGYSLGGAAAIAVFNDTKADAKKPVLRLGEELHTGEDAAHDITWGTFPLWQTAYFGKFLIDGTMHHDFCDDTFWKTIHPAYGSDHGSDRHESPGRNYEYVRQGFYGLRFVGPEVVDSGRPVGGVARGCLLCVIRHIMGRTLS